MRPPVPSNFTVCSEFRSGASLFRKSLMHVGTVFAMTWILLTARLWPAQTGGSQTTSERALATQFEQDSECFGSVVEKTEFPGVSDSDQKMFRDMLPLHEGDVLDRARLRDSLRALFATGRFADLKAECARSADNKAVISFVSSPNFFVGSVSVEGAPGKPSDSQIVNASKLQLGELYSADKMDRALKNLQRLLEENGFYRSVITHSERQNPANQQVEVTFRIHSG